MKLSSKIRPAPFWLELYNKGSKAKGQVIFNKIYLKKDIYENLLKKNPDPINVGILLHEQEHVGRIKNEGWLIWNFKYIFLSDFRLKEELAADKARFTYYKKKKVNFDLVKRAKDLSSWVYFWPAPYENIKRKLQEVWEKS